MGPMDDQAKGNPDNPLRKVGKKGDRATIELRVSKVVELLSLAWSTTEIRQYCAAEWGLAVRTSDTIIQRARKQITARWNQDRTEFIAERLDQLQMVTRKAIEAEQHSAAVGAIGLMGKFTRTTGS